MARTHRAEAPSGDVTLLFTDIVGSTTMWEQHGDAFLPVLQAHNAILMDAISRYGGYVMKTEGDCFKVAFADPTSAVQCAVLAQAALNRYPWPADVGKISVRMALHSGTPFLQSGDYFGPPVNRTARVLSAAHGGQILITEEMGRRVRWDRDPELEQTDLGHHRLKDLDEPLRLYQVLHPALEDRSFPPPRTLSAHPNNLPVQRTTFVGREAEIERIAGQLSRGESNVLALTGPGGAGKTRLTLQAAAEGADMFPDGVWYVCLDTATDLNSAAAAVAQSIGLAVEPETLALPVVREWLSHRRCLLILDDCGNVPEAGVLLRELLSGAPALRCLATARGSLDLTGVDELAVKELTVPADDAGPRELMLTEGGRLFVERALTANPAFTLNPDRANAISRILNRMPAMPRVIEMAADMLPKAAPHDLLDALSGVAKQVAQFGAQVVNRASESHEFAAVLQQMGNIKSDRHELSDAERNYRQALGIYQNLPNDTAERRSGIAACLRHLGNIALRQNDNQRAVTLLSAALQAATESHASEAQPISLELATARRALGLRTHAKGVELDQAVAIALTEPPMQPVPG